MSLLRVMSYWKSSPNLRPFSKSNIKIACSSPSYAQLLCHHRRDQLRPYADTTPVLQLVYMDIAELTPRNIYIVEAQHIFSTST